MAKKHIHITTVGGLECMVFEKLNIMMMMHDVQQKHASDLVLPGVTSLGGALYTTQSAASKVARHLAHTSKIQSLRVPSWEDWLECVNQIQPLQPKDSSLLVSRFLSVGNIPATNIVETLQLKYGGFRYHLNSQYHAMYCQNLQDGRYWTSTKNRYIQLEGSRMYFDYITQSNRGFPLRLIADAP